MTRLVPIAVWVALLAASPAAPGEAVFGPHGFSRAAGPPVRETVTFDVDDPSGTFWLQVDNGENGERLVTSARIWLNGVPVAGPDDFNRRVLGFSRDVTLLPGNVVEVEVRGEPGSVLTVEIRRAEPNPTASNARGDLDAARLGDQVVLWWSREPQAESYVFFRATSSDGPWEEILRHDAAEAGSGGATDSTPEASQRPLCYRIEAVAQGRVVRRYAPVCLPALDGLSRTEAEAALGREAAVAAAPTTPASDPANNLCLGDDEFTDHTSMDLAGIREFLRSRDSFLRGRIRDVDDVEIEPAAALADAARDSRISPRVLLTTLQKEQGAVTRRTRLPDDRLTLIMGFGAPSTVRDQIRDAAAQLRRNVDRLSRVPPQPASGGWQVGVARDSLDPLSVTPASRAVATLYSYTPWVGQAFDGRRGIGGNGLFCEDWEDFGFRANPLALLPRDGTLDCPDGSVTLTASGGRPPYVWSATKGVLEAAGATATLRPPRSSVPGVAYFDFRSRDVGNGIALEAHLHICDDGIAGACFGNIPKPLGGGDCTADPVGPATCGWTVWVTTACPPQRMCDGTFFQCDQRTPAMIEAGCKPCSLEMGGGSVVTVTDAAGVSVTAPVAVTPK
ncbi:MAG: hypothetical protein HY317_02335 [Acidobacteria bacterium]|nr:hypothetical protein [Acidobacteriota bacterium]